MATSGFRVFIVGASIALTLVVLVGASPDGRAAFRFAEEVFDSTWGPAAWRDAGERAHVKTLEARVRVGSSQREVRSLLEALHEQYVSDGDSDVVNIVTSSVLDFGGTTLVFNYDRRTHRVKTIVVEAYDGDD